MTSAETQPSDDFIKQLLIEGEKQRAEGNYSEAIATFTKAMEAFSAETSVKVRAGTFLRRGMARGASKDLLGSITDFSEAIRLDPNNSISFYNRGVSQEFLQEYPLAMCDYCEAVRLRPQIPVFRLRRGLCFKKLSNIAEARKEFAIVRDLLSQKKMEAPGMTVDLKAFWFWTDGKVIIPSESN